MATDWSDPEQVERELRRRERGEPSGDDSPSDMRLLLGAMHAVLKAQKQTDTQTASLAEDIATLRGLLARLEDTRSAAQQPAPEKPRNRPDAVAANLILGGIKAKQGNVDMVRRPRVEHRRRDGPVPMRTNVYPIVA